SARRSVRRGAPERPRARSPAPPAALPVLSWPAFEHAELATDLAEGPERLLELPPRQGCGHLSANACLPLRHHRIGEADDVHAALEEPVGHAGGERRIPDHDRNDRMLPGLEIEAGALEAGTEEARVLEELRAQLRGALEEVQHREARRGHDRRDAVREQVGARALPQPLYELARRGHIAAGAAAQGLAEGAGGVAVTLSLAQADAVDDARVIEGVRDHRVALIEQRLEQAAVGVEARGVQDHVLGAEEAGELLLERLVARLRAADEAHRGHAV